MSDISDGNSRPIIGGINGKDVLEDLIPVLRKEILEGEPLFEFEE